MQEHHEIHKNSFLDKCKLVINTTSVALIQNKLSKEQNEKTIDKQIHKLANVVYQMEISPVRQNLNNGIKDFVNTLSATSHYIIDFYYGNFEKAFEETYDAYYKLEKNGPKQMMLVDMIDSLCAIKNEVKTERQKSIYNKNYAHLENHLCQLLEDATVHHYVENYTVSNGVSSDQKLMEKSYNGSYMSLAYMNYLNNNMDKAKEYLNKLIEEQGIEQVIERECDQKHNKWFYRHQPQSYIDFVKEHIVAVVSENTVKVKQTI
jgi:hypothetical protein